MGIPTLVAALLTTVMSSADPDPCLVSGALIGEAKVSAESGGFMGVLSDGDVFGSAVAVIGDLNGDGVDDLAVGAPSDDDGGIARGAIWILFMNPDGTVGGQSKISDIEGGFGGGLENTDRFGQSVASLGDLNNDGTPDIAVGAPFANDGFPGAGAVWIVYLNADGSVADESKISLGHGGFEGNLESHDHFGISLAVLRDIDGNGAPELVVGAEGEDAGADNAGAVWVVKLNPDGTVLDEQRIGDGFGGFDGSLNIDDRFGASVASLGDLDGDGVDDIAVGAAFDSTAGTFSGAVWILNLTNEGKVKSEIKITEAEGNFQGDLDDFDNFGSAVGSLGDLDGDGRNELAVGAGGDSDGGALRGAVWVLFLAEDGSVRRHSKVSDLQGGFVGPLDNNDRFGNAVALWREATGEACVCVGAPFDDDGGDGKGATWFLTLAAASCQGDIVPDGTVDGLDLQLLLQHFGQSVSPECLVDTDGDGLVGSTDLNRLLESYGSTCGD